MFEKFTVIDLIKTRSESICIFKGDTIKFNIQTAAELGYPSHIQFLIHAKNKQFGIRVCAEDAPNAAKFSRPEGNQKYSINIRNATVASLVRKVMGWSAEDSWSIPGIIFANERGILYDLGSGKQTKPRGKWAKKETIVSSEATPDEA